MKENGSIKCCRECYMCQPNGVRVCFACGYEFFPSKRDKLMKLLEEAYEAGANDAYNQNANVAMCEKYVALTIKELHL